LSDIVVNGGQEHLVPYLDEVENDHLKACLDASDERASDELVAAMNELAARQELDNRLRTERSSALLGIAVRELRAAARPLGSPR
jgi:hypothetical protein